MAKVIVGLSGGVDSAVCAYLLKQSGYDVIGVTLRTWRDSETEVSKCCELDDAAEIAKSLDIPFYIHNVGREFCTYVTTPFVEEYLCGRTPNPCVDCNRHVKWEGMLYAMHLHEADYVATGHYAKIIKLQNGRYTARVADAAAKDQTYMLYQLTQEQLSHTLMPLGDYTKDDVRHIAKEAGIPVAEKPDSQEICFVADGHYADYVKEHSENRFPPEGNFVDEEGNVLGKHKGIVNYTIGQRKGLGIAFGHPMYVKEIRPETDEVVLSEEDALFSKEVLCRDLNFLSIEGMQPGEELRAYAKIRYRHKAEAATLRMEQDGILRLSFDSPVRAATPGQAAVYYDEDGCVIGGGKIFS